MLQKDKWNFLLPFIIWVFRIRYFLGPVNLCNLYNLLVTIFLATFFDKDLTPLINFDFNSDIVLN